MRFASLMPESDVPLPHGVRRLSLPSHPDERGFVAEIFRESWETGVQPLQWTVTVSRPGVLRGVHVHLRHVDYLVATQGRIFAGLFDLRQGSPTERQAVCIDLDAEQPSALVIPPGVAHGFFFLRRAVFLNATSAEWDPEDDLACHWRDPDLGIPWPAEEAIVSPRDASAPPLRELLSRLEPHQPIACR